MSAGGMLSKGRSHPLERWGFAVLCVGVAGFVLVLVGPASSVSRRNEIILGLMIGGFMLLSVVGTFMVLKGRQRGARDVMARAGRLCPRCRYPLPASEDLGVCPECGDPFTHDDNLMAWRERYPWLRL